MFFPYPVTYRLQCSAHYQDPKAMLSHFCGLHLPVRALFRGDSGTPDGPDGMEDEGQHPGFCNMPAASRHLLTRVLPNEQPCCLFLEPLHSPNREKIPSNNPSAKTGSYTGYKLFVTRLASQTKSLFISDL